MTADTPRGRTDAAGVALVRKCLEDVVRDLSSDRPVPGGGTAAALAGTLAAACLSMACKISAKKLQAGSSVDVEEMLVAASEAEKAALRLLVLAEEDSQAYEGVVQARRAARETRLSRRESPEVRQAYLNAASVPLETARTCLVVAEKVTTVVNTASPVVVTDLFVALSLAVAACRSALANVLANAGCLNGPSKRELELQVEPVVEGIKRCYKSGIEELSFGWLREILG